MSMVFPQVLENHDLRVVAGAALISLLASLLAIVALKQVRGSLVSRLAWLAAAAAAAGVGIWATHVVAMLGYAPGVPLAHAAGGIFLGIVPAILNAGIGFALCTRQRSAAWFAGTFIGAGMVMTHYQAMTAVSMHGVSAWHWGLIAASIVLAIAFSIAACWTFQRDGAGRVQLSALLLGIGMFGHHVVGMAALQALPPVHSHWVEHALDWGMFQKIAGVTMVLMLIATLGALFHDRNGLTRKLEEAAEFRRLADELKRQIEITTAAFDNMAHGLSMYDAQGRLVIWNRRYEQLFGMAECFLTAGMRTDEVQRHQIESGIVSGSAVDGYMHERSRQPAGTTNYEARLLNDRIVSVQRRSLENGGWIVTHQDVTEREQLLAELRREHDISTAALDNMALGLSMYDMDDRLITFNRRYAEMFDVPDGIIVPGMSHGDILRYHVEAGHVPAYFLRGVRELSHDSRDFEFTLSNGHTFEVHRRPLESGGWLLTHEDVTEKRRASERIAYLATHDDLTGLPNRRSFAEALRKATAAARDGAGFALLTIDLDRFKEVNDTLGHPVGDQILKETAARLRSIAADDDVLTRLGGDEFAVLQRRGATPDEAALFASQVIAELGRAYEFDGHTITVGATVGIAIAGDDRCQADDVVKRSDLALYRAKNHSRGSYCFFEDGMDAHLRARRELDMGLRLAVQKAEFELFYQPLLNVASRSITGFEALVRWHHPTRGLLQPMEFIPAAEDSGLIIPIGEWVLRQACRDAARWPSSVRVAVNLSAAQLKRGDLLAMTKSALGAAGLSPDRLQIELTESVLLHDEEWVRSLLLQLRELGVTIAMDDFGTGYSSLSYLRTFPFGKIKIDKSFVADMEVNKDALAIVQATIDLSRKLGMCTTAEGVETAEQQAILTAEGCTEIQGFLISPPVPVDQVWDILERHGTADVHRLSEAS